MAKNTIFAGDACKRPRQQEAITSQADILPGMLVVRSSGEFIKHATAGQGGDYFIAKENSLAQESVTDLYASGDTVFAYQPSEAGTLFNIAIAASQNITAVGTPITSNGAGYGRIALTTGAEEVLFYADEVVNVTSAGTLVRCRVAAAGFNA